MYVINITTKTASTDIYKRVSLNLYPIIVFGDFDYLKSILASDEMKNKIKSLLRTPDLYEAGEYYIREIIDDDEINNMSFPIKDFTDIIY